MTIKEFYNKFLLRQDLTPEQKTSGLLAIGNVVKLIQLKKAIEQQHYIATILSIFIAIIFENINLLSSVIVFATYLITNILKAPSPASFVVRTDDLVIPKTDQPFFDRLLNQSPIEPIIQELTIKIQSELHNKPYTMTSFEGALMAVLGFRTSAFVNFFSPAATKATIMYATTQLPDYFADILELEQRQN